MSLGEALTPTVILEKRQRKVAGIAVQARQRGYHIWASVPEEEASRLANVLDARRKQPGVVQLIRRII